MGNNQENCNMVFLAGTVETVKVNEDKKGAFALINPEGETKFIPCTIYDTKELAEKLSRFQKGDFIKVVGMLRAWSQKKDGGWKNVLEVRITQIKNDPPRRSTSRQQNEEESSFPF